MFKIALIIYFALTLATSAPLCNEDTESLNSRLAYFLKRFTKIENNLQNEDYADELRNLKNSFEKALLSKDSAIKASLLEAYDNQLEASFKHFLRMKIDEQYINEEILINAWYMKHLAPQLNEMLATEIVSLLLKYEMALKVQSLEEKYNFYADISTEMSAELMQILDSEPEHEALINIHLQYTKMYLDYLLQERMSNDFQKQIVTILNEIDQALTSGSYEQKLDILSYFDDMQTAFGRFLNYKMNEFEFTAFSA